MLFEASRHYLIPKQKLPVARKESINLKEAYLSDPYLET